MGERRSRCLRRGRQKCRWPSHRAFLRVLALLGIVVGAIALTLSGHAGTVEPRRLTQSGVLLHGLCVAFWIGALFPLLRAIQQPDRGR